MKRFIHHDELARDSRFVRQSNAQSTILASLPDDVDTVVAAFDQFTPMIEESVKGTAAEPLFREALAMRQRLYPSDHMMVRALPAPAVRGAEDNGVRSTQAPDPARPPDLHRSPGTGTDVSSNHKSYRALRATPRHSQARKAGARC